MRVWNQKIEHKAYCKSYNLVACVGTETNRFVAFLEWNRKRNNWTWCDLMPRSKSDGERDEGTHYYNYIYVE